MNQKLTMDLLRKIGISIPTSIERYKIIQTRFVKKLASSKGDYSDMQN
jgi:hypothetical protein